jgi:hypothetical protein
MGQYLSGPWFIYRRDLDDTWMDKPISTSSSNENNIIFHMGRFKHHVFELGLNKIEIHKIYLYQKFRHAKAFRQDDKIIVMFSSTEAKKAWFNCKRSKLGLTFDKVFDHISNDVNSESIVFQRKTGQNVLSYKHIISMHSQDSQSVEY